MMFRQILQACRNDRLATAGFIIVPLVILFERLPGEQWWPTLLLVYSPQVIWVIPAALMLAFALVKRRWIAAGASALSVILVFTVLMTFHLPHPSPKSTSDLRVLTWNLNYGHGGKSLPKLALTVWPDVICLQEANPWAEKHLEKMLDLPQFKDWHAKVCGELVILSRFPLKRLGTTHSALWVSADVRGNEVIIADVHLALPYRPGGGMVKPGQLYSADRLRSQQTQEILSKVTYERPVIVCGDFNTPPNTEVYRTLRSRMKNAFEDAGRGYGMTFPKNLPLVRIDHIFISVDCRTIQCSMPTIDASNHRPLCADIHLPEEIPAYSY